MCTDASARASSADTNMHVSIPQKPLKSYLGVSLKTNTPVRWVGRFKFTLDGSCLSGANFSTLSWESSTWLKKNTRSSILYLPLSCVCVWMLVCRVWVCEQLTTGQCTAVSGKGWTWSVGFVCLVYIVTRIQANALCTHSWTRIHIRVAFVNKINSLLVLQSLRDLLKMREGANTNLIFLGMFVKVESLGWKTHLLLHSLYKTKIFCNASGSLKLQHRGALSKMLMSVC